MLMISSLGKAACSHFHNPFLQLLKKCPPSPAPLQPSLVESFSLFLLGLIALFNQVSFTYSVLFFGPEAHFAALMELGDGGEALCLVSNSRNARSDGGNDLMDDAGLKGFGDVRFVELACGSGREAHVGDGEESCHEVGYVGFRETGFCKVGCGATSSSIDVRMETRTHSRCSTQTDCQPYSNIGSEASCEVGNGKAVGHDLEAGNYPHCVFNSGIEDFSEVGNGGEASNSGLVLSCEAGNGEFQGWMSPRISFSRDFVMVDIDMALPNDTQSSSSRVSPEKRKWEQQDDNSLDFEFLRYVPMREGAVDPANGFMLSADELFSDGKLLPVPFCNNWAPCDDFYLPSTAEQHHQQSAKLSLYKSSASRPMARHLSFEMSRPHCTTSHGTFSCASSPSRVLHEDSSSCTASGLHSSSSSSMSTSLPLKKSSLAPMSSLTILSSPSSKYSAKLKDIFKTKKVSADSLPSELSRDNSFTSTCRLPISPRSFWPFARSSSICDSKASTARRLILEMDATSLTSISSQNVDSNQDARPCSSSMTEPSKIQGLMVSINEEKSGAPSAGEVSNADAFLESHAHSRKLLNNVVDALKDGKEHNVSSDASKLRASASSSEVLKKTCVTSSFARGSPGRRGGMIKVNSGKIVLRNLERCSAEKRLGRDGWKGLSKRSSYCAATRVSPVLNVAIYRGGNGSKNGFFGFGSLFSSRKSKKPMEAAAINWRKGA